MKHNMARFMRQIPVLEFHYRRVIVIRRGAQSVSPKKNTLKSGKLRTVDSLVLHQVIWPHEIVYAVVG